MINPNALPHTYPEPNNLGRIYQTVLEEMLSGQVPTMTADKLVDYPMWEAVFVGFTGGVVASAIVALVIVLCSPRN